MIPIRFEKIIIEGFGSIVKPLEYKLDRKGLSCILGPNGAGKTTIFSALHWALYRSPLKGNPTPWYKSNNFKGTRVCVFFSKGETKYRVESFLDYKGELPEIGKGHNKICLFIDGQLQKHFRDNNDVKPEIIKILGMSSTLFKNSILFGQKLKRIIQESGPDKKKVFEEAFDAAFLTDAKILVDSKLIEYRNSIVSYDNNIYDLEEKLEDLERQQSKSQRQLSDLKERKARLKEKLITLKPFKDFKEKGLKTLSKEISIMEGQLEKKKELEKDIFTFTLSLSKHKGSLELAQSTLKEIRSELTRVSTRCHLCNSKLKPEKIKAAKDKVKKRLKDQLDDVAVSKLKVKVLTKKLAEFEAELSEYKIFEAKLQKLKNERSDLRVNLEKAKNYNFFKSELGKLKTQTFEVEDFRPKIQEVKKEIETLKNLKKKLDKSEAIYTWIANKALSNSGIKNFIFNELLAEVNYKLLEYASYLGFRIEFGIDLDSARKDFYAVCYKKDIPVSYSELSGGQQQLVDIAIAFSIHDVVNKTRKTNLLIMDEVFESLDEENIEIVSGLIAHKALEKSVHLITHRKEFNTSSAFTLKLKLNKDGQTIAL